MHKTAPKSRSRYTRRRGSMIVLAIGVLAVLAIIALSYTAAVRVERTGVQTFANRIDGERQVDAVVSEIQALLTADLFGNKIVTGETPRYTFPNAGVAALTSVWPRMFEDGEYADVPGVDNVFQGSFYTFNTEPVGAAPSPGSVLDLIPNTVRYPPAYSQDDAWLGSTEPVNAANNLNGRWDMWPTITNLRSAYRWVLTGPNTWAWVRGDGKFADLGQWFLSEVAIDAEHGDPDADLTAFEDPLSGDENGPILGVNQQVYEYQMSAMQELIDGFNPDADEPLPLTNADTRFWADTDGDLRPDARWQTLESFGNLNGLRWVAAVRIIDNSSMVNVNTALTLGEIDPNLQGAPEFDGPFDLLGAGLTPADVDLLRLLRTARLKPDLFTLTGSGWESLIADPTQWRLPGSAGWQQYGGSTGSYTSVFHRQHMESQLRLHDAVNALNLNFDGNNDPVDDYDLTVAELPRRLRRVERDLLFDASLSAASRSLGAGFGDPYAIDNEAELRAYWGVNREDTLSQLEQRLDAGYLPQQVSPGVVQFDADTGAQLEMGPLRSADRQRNSRGLALTGRELGQANFALRPTFEEIRDDLRRHVTTVSGAADFSPVPVVNDAIETLPGSPSVDQPVYDPSAINRKVRFSEFPSLTLSREHESNSRYLAEMEQKSEAVSRAYEAFVWSLAPFATDQSMSAGWTDPQWAAIAAGASSAYFYGGGLSATSPADSAENAAYAVLRAASLAVNLADAVDTDTPSLTDLSPSDVLVDVYEPTVARLHNVRRSPDRMTDSTISGPAGFDPAVPDAVEAIELGARFSQGDIPPALLPASIVPAGNAGVTLVGLDRQPFLREVASFAGYRDDMIEAQFPPGGDDQIDPANPAEQVGSLMAIELGNPWPDPIDVRNLIIRLVDATGAASIDIPLNPASLTDDERRIEPGSFKIFFIESFNPNAPNADEWTDMKTAWRDLVEAQAGDTSRVVEVPLTGASLDPIMFKTWDLSPGGFAALLLTDLNLDQTPEYLIDRMKATATTEEFPADLRSPYSTFILSPGEGVGRVTISASMSRRLHPAERASEFSAATAGRAGFPAYVLERPAANVVSPPHTYDYLWSILIPETDPGAAAAFDSAGGDWNLLGVQTRTGDIAKGDLPGMPSFQLLVPNRAFDAVGDLAMLPAFTHMYIHSGAGVPQVDNATLAAQGDLTTPYPGTDQWRTISEQLGADRQISYNNQPLDVSGLNANPYLGVLDPTRYILGQGVGDLGPVANLPDSLAVPLAVRVFDCFEALPIPDAAPSLIAGRINLNTAPERTLRTLPMMSPDVALLWPTADIFDGGLAAPGGALDRAGLTLDYLEPLRLGQSTVARSSLVGIPGLRQPGYAGRAARGVAAAGELSLLSSWSSSALGAPEPQSLAGYGVHHFAEAALPDAAMQRVNTGVEHRIDAFTISNMDLSSATRFDVDQVLDRYPSAGHDVNGVLVPLDPVDDAEERTAIYRAMSNIVSTRSDVFTAWIVIRGYDPARISTIPFPQNFDGADRDEVAALMNQLTPTHESRWLAVFDRSNVRTPTDRPKVLLLTRLPTR